MEDVQQVILDKIEKLSRAIDRLCTLLEGRSKSHYTVEEVAQMTARSPFTVRTHWIGKGILKAIKMNGGKYLIEAAEVNRLIASGLGGQLRISTSTPVVTATITTRPSRFGGPLSPLKPYSNQVASRQCVEDLIAEHGAAYCRQRGIVLVA